MNRDLLIETRNLTKRYGSRIVAVDSLNLNVRRGEVYGFLGPNGARKTTILRMLLDLIHLTSGTATVLGEPTNGLDPKGMAEMRELIRSLGWEERTVLLSSHLMGEVEQICDRIGVIRSGRLCRRRLRDRASLHSHARLPKKRRGVIQDVSCGETASEIRCNG